jgi:membrane-associated protease RseP (regulator of RpoE activity)
METAYDYEILDALVGRIFATEDVTLGTSKSLYVVRYRGMLRGDSESAYDQLAGWLKPYGLTPLFRWEDHRHSVLLIPELPKTNVSNPVINLVLAILTVFSALLTGALYSAPTLFPPEPLQIIQFIFADPGQVLPLILANGWPFALSMLAILGCHEFGHFLVGRYHGVNVTLPYFIPLPFSPFGTLGAFINMKEPPKNRKVLLDIGVAGPLAGFIIAVPILLLGLTLSQVSQLSPPAPGFSIQMEGSSILYLLSKFVVFGQLLPFPATYAGLNPLLYWVRYFFTSYPLPIGGLDVSLGPVAWAGWAGLLVTALNLIPAGQLDGGHMIYVLLGRERARKLFPVILVILIALGFVWLGWWLWAALIYFFGRFYAEPLDQITPINGWRKALAITAMIIFVLTFTPVPLS